MNYIVVFGNPVDGLSFYGPFNSHIEAETYAEDAESDWWIAELNEAD